MILYHLLVNRLTAGKWQDSAAAFLTLAPVLLSSITQAFYYGASNRWYCI